MQDGRVKESDEEEVLGRISKWSFRVEKNQGPPDQMGQVWVSLTLVPDERMPGGANERAVVDDPTLVC